MLKFSSLLTLAFACYLEQSRATVVLSSRWTASKPATSLPLMEDLVPACASTLAGLNQSLVNIAVTGTVQRILTGVNTMLK
jgi:hypothetical protein